LAGFKNTAFPLLFSGSACWIEIFPVDSVPGIRANHPINIFLFKHFLKVEPVCKQGCETILIKNILHVSSEQQWMEPDTDELRERLMDGLAFSLPIVLLTNVFPTF
jgi:hypothetical protein